MTELVEDHSTAHRNSDIVIVDLNDVQYALTPQSAIELYRSLSTSIGCIAGVDADVMTGHNSEMRDVKDTYCEHRFDEVATVE